MGLLRGDKNDRADLELRNIVCVEDLERTRRFYEEGLGLKARTLDGDVEGICRLASASGRFELLCATWDDARRLWPRRYPEAPPERPGLGMILQFVVDDVDGAFARALAAGGLSVEQPRVMKNGERMGTMKDPDGYQVTIVSRDRQTKDEG